MEEKETFASKFKNLIGMNHESETDSEENTDLFQDEFLEEGSEEMTDTLDINKDILFSETESSHFASSFGEDGSIIIQEPVNYDEITQSIDRLKQDKTIIINFKQLAGEWKKNAYHFMLGAVYALEGNVEKVDSNIFIITPKSVKISTAGAAAETVEASDDLKLTW
jgi:cell division inhibitor SepF